MQPGKYDKKITIEAAAQTRDAHGGVIEGWQSIKEMWAHLRQQSPKEIFAADQVQNLNTAIFIIRYTTGIDAGMRVVHEGKVYDIQGPPIELGRRNQLQIICQWNGDTAYYTPEPCIDLEPGTIY